MTRKNSVPVNNKIKTLSVPDKSGDQPANPPAAPTAVIKSTEPEPEAWSYMGIDSTSPIEISSMEIIDDDDQTAFTTWMGQIKKPKKGQKMPTEQLIQGGIELIKGISADANRLINEANKNFADRAITIGRIFLKLKELIRGNEKPWGAWTEENLPFIAKRNREKYTLITSRPDCWPFSFLGVDRLELLCSVTRAMEGKDRIGDLLHKYEIPFDEDSEVNMSEFKAMIDAAINNERLVKNGLMINFNLVTNIINLGVDFDKSLIRRLKDISDCGGNPEALLQKISLTGGREDMDVTPEKRLQDFNHLTNRLLKTLDFIIGDQDQLVKIDRETFRLLLEKLVSIQDLGILKNEEGQSV
jgi:hypothetical protein